MTATPISTAIHTLHVFYDERCSMCRAARKWIEGQPKYVNIEFTAYQSPEAESICPGIGKLRPDREIVVMADNGAVYQGGTAWIMCLWALGARREMSMRLASPMLLPLAKKICHLVSRNRLKLSKLFGGGRSESDLAGEIESATPYCGRCDTGTCAKTQPAER